MGYTHYWTVTDKDAFAAAMPAIAADARQIVDALDIRVVYEVDYAAVPQITEDHIRLNGHGAEGHETFILGADRGFSFCKTARKPYDLIVTMILVRAQWHAGPAIEVSSDGTNDDWEPAYRLTSEVFADK